MVLYCLELKEKKTILDYNYILVSVFLPEDTRNHALWAAVLLGQTKRG